MYEQARAYLLYRQKAQKAVCISTKNMCLPNNNSRKYMLTVIANHILGYNMQTQRMN